MAATREHHQLHILFLPYFATGHIIPLVNAARLFAARGVKATILTTHHNASLFQPSIENVTNISVHKLRFPFTEVGAPEGIENYSTSTSAEMAGRVFYGSLLLQKPMEEAIRHLRPDCIFSDMYFPWTIDLARELNIPRLSFNQASYMYNSMLHNIRLYKPHQESETGSFVIPGLPDKIEFKVSQLTEDLRKPEDAEKNIYEKLVDQIRDTEDLSYGIVHDTFYELEPAYADYYQKTKKKAKCWHIGPISHFFSSKSQRNELINSSSFGTGNSGRSVTEWLNKQKPKSVLYVSFGSLARFPEEQLIQIAQALQDSTVPFIWVLKKDQADQTTKGWLPDGFEEKNEQGLIIRGWAPQLTILNHSAVGGFMTHCGWNSVLETIAAGVPMLTWPLLADQFYNEKLVEVVGLGIKVGAEVCNYGTEVTSPVLGSQKIKEAIGQLMMSGSEEIEKIRDKAVAMSKMANAAIEGGGSSWDSLTALIDDIKNFPFLSSSS